MRACLLASACCLVLTAARANQFKTLYTFSGGQDGAAPEAPLIAGPDGTLYGTTSAGGGGPCINPLDIPGCGTVFSLTPPAQGKTAWNETILHRFADQADGATPYAGLVQDAAGNLYGTTYVGGNGTGSDCGVLGCGIVFELSPPAQGKTKWTKTTLYMLQEAKSGALPRAHLVMDSSGALLGTASLGGPGASYPGGTVFRLVPPTGGKKAWKVTTLYVFKGGRDGSVPFAGLLPAADGSYYGTTYEGGTDNFDCEDSGCGTAYQIIPPAHGNQRWKEHVLHRFVRATDGAFPLADLVTDTQGNLFGTSAAGGGGPENGGTVWRLSPPSQGMHWSRAVLHAFGFSNDGNSPNAGVVLDANGVLYGTTLQGAGANSDGMAFSLTPPSGKGAWRERVIHSFPNTKPQDSNPSSALLIGPDGALYGTTAGNGGPTGTVFSIAP